MLLRDMFGIDHQSDNSNSKKAEEQVTKQLQMFRRKGITMPFQPILRKHLQLKLNRITYTAMGRRQIGKDRALTIKESHS